MKTRLRSGSRAEGEIQETPIFLEARRVSYFRNGIDCVELLWYFEKDETQEWSSGFKNMEHICDLDKFALVKTEIKSTTVMIRERMKALEIS